MNKYLITLTPLDWFFFGGERTHDEGERSDYLAKSNYFPQQSAIIGLLRYQLLKQNGLLTYPGKVLSTSELLEIENLIGKRSFNLDNWNTPFEFGKINSISPLSIIRKRTSDFYFPVSMDEGYQPEFKPTKVCLNGVEKDQIIYSSLFDHKTYNNYLVWSSKKSSLKLKTDDIWINQSKIGITKPKAGEENIKSFYKQEQLMFKDDFTYAFFADIDHELFPDIVFLGGQRSAFKMDVTLIGKDSFLNASESYMDNIVQRSETGKIILLSNTYVADYQQLNSLCRFHWSDVVTFKNILTDIKKKNYYVRPKKSTKYHLFRYGSVLYFDEDHRRSIEDLIYKPYLQSAGYNYYV